MCNFNQPTPTLNVNNLVNTASNILSFGQVGIDNNGAIAPGVASTAALQAYSKVSGQDAQRDADFNAQQVNKAQAAQDAQIAASRQTRQQNDVNASNTAASVRKAAGNQSLGTLGFSAIQALPQSNPGKDFLGL